MVKARRESQRDSQRESRPATLRLYTERGRSCRGADGHRARVEKPDRQAFHFKGACRTEEQEHIRLALVRQLSCLDAMRVLQGSLADSDWSQPTFAAKSACFDGICLLPWKSASRDAASSFLSGPAPSTLVTSFQAFSAGGMGKRPPRPEDMLKHPKLDRQVKVRLLYQSPEIYATDVASEKPYIGPDYGCFRADQDGKGEMGFMHPEITFNALPPIFGGIQEVHVHLEDTTSNLVFWDADFKLPMLDPVVNLVGKTRLKKFAMPKSMMDKFYKLCVPKDDIRPHFFDLSVRTIGKYWDEDLKEFRPNKGFARGRSPEAHIGFTVQRMPSLDFEGKEKPGDLAVWIF